MIGSKYQTYIDDELVILRVLKKKDNGSYTVTDGEHKIIMNEEDFKSCVKLLPDAVMNIMVTISTEGAKDVYVCVNKTSDMTNNISNPSLILRQDVYSMSKNSFNGLNSVFVGECFTVNNCPDVNTFSQLLEFDFIKHTLSISLYIDDTLDDILEVLGSRANKINEVLGNMKLSTDKSMIQGYCSTLKELMIDNNFMSNFRNVFNITSIDFPIELDNNVSDNTIILNSKQQSRIEDILRKYITDVKVIKYDKDIDVSKIVGNTHIMISDSTDKIYLISYVVAGQYPIDNDIMEAMKNNK